MRCEIILTGNELLIGKTIDSNGIWTIKQLTPLGVRIIQLSMIRDDLNEIRDAVRNALARQPDFLLLSGGLGPTFDDMTLKGLHYALSGNLSLKLNPKAQQWILSRYHNRFPDASEEELLQRYPYIQKMASMPVGGTPLQNLNGTAPGARIDPEYTNTKTTIVSMPGIPEEYQNMFTIYVLSEIQERLQQDRYLECGFIFQNIPESGFANKIYAIKDQYPDLWFKTHPHRAENHQWEIELHISSFATNDTIPDQMKTVYSELYEFVEEKGGKILNTNPPDFT